MVYSRDARFAYVFGRDGGLSKVDIVNAEISARILQSGNSIGGAISQETWDECAKHFPTDRERIELVATIGNWKMISEVLKSLEVPLDEGFAAWPPDGVSPATMQEGV